MSYQIEWNYRGKWTPLDEDIFDEDALPFDELKAAVARVRSLDTYEGKTSYRVIDGEGVIHYQKSEMYERVFNIYTPNLLREMQQSLGVDDETWIKAIHYWLEHYTKENN